MFEDRIAKGVAWLEKYDKGWFNKINLDRLCMSSNDGCVLGQWYRGDVSTHFGDDWTRNRGFSLSRQLDIADQDCQIEWVLLRDEWTKVIKEKRAGKSMKTKQEVA